MSEQLPHIASPKDLHELRGPCGPRPVASPEITSHVVERLLAWGSGIPEFDRTVASMGALVARCYLGEDHKDEEPFFLLALVCTWWVWIDDWSDRHLREARVSWELLLGFLRGQPRATPPWPPELDFLLRMSSALEQRAQTQADYSWWLTSAAHNLEAARREEEWSRSEDTSYYAEYLDNGYRSISALNVLATASLVLGLHLGSRCGEPLIVEGGRFLSTVARLENDLHSYHRDRREGCKANALLVLEQYLPSEKARAFVEAEVRSYRRLLSGTLEKLGPRDPFVVVVRRTLSTQSRFYELFGKNRYVKE